MTQTSNGFHTEQSTVVDQVMDAVTRSQRMVSEMTTGMAEMWGAALSSADDATRRRDVPAFPTLPGLPAGLPTPAELVDRTIDTSIAVLEMQRSVAHQMLDAMRVR